MKKILILPLLLLLGCSNSDNSSSSTTTSTPTSSNTIDYSKSVEVFTIAPVINALVQDANKQIASFDINTSKYIFQNTIAYPITVTPTSQTYIDIDYDKNKTSMDIKPKFSILKSFNTKVNLLTNLYYSSEYNDSNVSMYQYESLIQDKFNINIENSPLADENVAKVLFATYNYTLDNTLHALDDIDTDVDNVNNFFSYYLSLLDVNKTKYYSIYDSLLQLDKHKIQRTDTLHKPHITVLRDDINITSKNNDLDVFDIVENNNYIYTASGHDEAIMLNNDLSYIQKSNAELLSFGNNLYKENYDTNTCLFLSDSKNGIKTFNISLDNLNEKSHILSYIDSTNAEQNFTNDSILEVNGYISPKESKRLLGITTNDNGFFLINIKDNFTNCTLNQDINSSTILIPASTPTTIQTTISSAFREDGTFVFVSSTNTILGYDLDILDKTNIDNTKTSFTIQNSESPYNLKLVNNDNELFVTTNKGIQVYDVSNSNNLNFTSEYTTEGAEDDYYPKIDFYNNYLFFTDGYKGLKVLKYDDSFNPMLCGVEYFAPKDNPEELAKVNSVKYINGYLYVGIDSYGIIKFKMEDILFKHCKE